MRRFSRSERHRRLADALKSNPLQTDEELARQLEVSVPTIRLDRLHLGIPELRRRTAGLAQQVVYQARALQKTEMIGELVDLELGRWGTSVLQTDRSMAFAQNGIVRSHYIFGQADSLAIAVMDRDMVLTGLATSKFKRPVRAGERLTAYGEIIRRHRRRNVVLIVTRVANEVVFRGKFVVFAWDQSNDSQT